MEQNSIGIVIERLDNFKTDNAQEHKAILEQVKKMNGSIAEIQKWRFLTTGALIIMNIFIVPIILAVVIKFVLSELF